jgi:hypothetical protein
MKCLRMSTALPSGRGDRAPPREPPLHIIPGFSPKGLSPRLAPRGGAGSARPRGRRGVDRGMCPVGHGPLASSSGGRRTLGHSDGGTTRAHRVHPSEKDPHIAMLPGWRANPCNWLLAPQAEGRALQARYRTLAPDRDMSLLRSRPLRVTRNWRNAWERVQAYRADVRSVSLLQIHASRISRHSPRDHLPLIRPKARPLGFADSNTFPGVRSFSLTTVGTG